MNKFLPLFLLPLAAFAQDAAPNPQGSMMQTFVMIGVALVFFYFILWRPEQKRRKVAEQMRGSMKKGDLVTAMGILGTIDRVKENTLILKMVEGAKIEILKAAVTEVRSAAQEDASKETGLES